MSVFFCLALAEDPKSLQRVINAMQSNYVNSKSARGRADGGG